MIHALFADVAASSLKIEAQPADRWIVTLARPDSCPVTATQNLPSPFSWRSKCKN
jgi:hypothetical protein